MCPTHFTTVVSLMCLLAVVCSMIASRLPNVPCRVQNTLVPVSPGSSTVYPDYVELQVCAGSTFPRNPKKFRCVPTSLHQVTVAAQSLISGETVLYALDNHTQCEVRCVAWADGCLNTQVFNKELCECQCRIGTYRRCPSRTTWNVRQCSCTCIHVDPCDYRHVWNGTSCECECSSGITRSTCEASGLSFDRVSCVCGSPLSRGSLARREAETKLQLEYVVLIAIVEFLVVACGVFALSYCLYQRELKLMHEETTKNLGGINSTTLVSRTTERTACPTEKSITTETKETVLTDHSYVSDQNTSTSKEFVSQMHL